MNGVGVSPTYRQNRSRPLNPRTLETLVLVHDVMAPLCALELEGVRGLASGSVRIQLQSRFVKALSFYMTLLLCERGVWR